MTYHLLIEMIQRLAVHGLRIHSVNFTAYGYSTKGLTSDEAHAVLLEHRRGLRTAGAGKAGEARVRRVRYLLDTDTCVYALKQEKKVLAALLACSPADVAISVITEAIFA